jgi:phenylpropionate dioxygenase-like ring-hydroxylating dioxygenase large terminal subunit
LARHAESPSRALPPTCYLDREFWEAEREQVLMTGWHAIARADELPEAGDYRSVDLHGEPIVLVRDESGSLRAYSRVCPHRASLLVEGDGNSRRLTCPYHRWSFDLDGCLRAAPLMEEVEGFERGAHRLPELALEIWQGFVFVNLAPEPAPLAASIAELSDALDGIDLSNYRHAGTTLYDSPWNWKVLIENFMESYHHLGTHAATLQPTIPAAGTYDAGVSGDCALLANPGVDDNRGASICAVFPDMLFFVSRDEKLPFAAWYDLRIDAIDHFELRIHVLLPPELASEAEAGPGFLQFLDTIHQEDIRTCDSVQRGLQSRLYRPTALAKQEDCLVRFHRYLADRMLTGEAGTTAG